MKHIPKKDLITGRYYKGTCRNAHEARWDGTIFIHWRTKFCYTYAERICCPEDDDHYDVFYATELQDTPEKEIPL